MVSVRAMHSADFDAVRRIYADGISTGLATFETEVPTAEELDAKWLPGQRWVAELDGRVVGWAAATPASTRPCYAGVAETSVYIDLAQRGKRIGSTLLRTQIEATEQGGFWTLQTSIFPQNTASIALHTGAGFRTVGTRERIARLNGVWQDTVLLERRSWLS
jgi:L-amino acid N-acyltransferase YncA